MKKWFGYSGGSTRHKVFWLVFLLFGPIISTFSHSADSASLLSLASKDGQIALSQPLILRWQYATDATVNLTPAMDGQQIYLPLTAGSLVSLRAYDGQMIWRTEIGGEISASPVADNRGVYIASATGVVQGKPPQAAGALRALGRESGVTLWMRTLPFPLQGALTMNERILFGGSSDGRVYAVSKKDGELLWVVQFPTSFSSLPVIANSQLLIGADDGTLLCLDQNTGKQLWRYRTRGPIRGRPSVHQGIIYFGSADGYVYALDQLTGQFRWRTRTGAGVQAVTVTAGGLIVASLDNFVYFLSLARGDRIWKRQLSGRIAAQPLAASDGALVIPFSSDSGVILDLRDGKQLNTIPIGEDNTTGAAPIVVKDVLFVTTRQGLLAFSRPA